MTKQPETSNVELTAAERRMLERMRNAYVAMAAAIDLILDLGEIQKVGDSFAEALRTAAGWAPAQSERRRRRGRVDEDPQA